MLSSWLQLSLRADPASFDAVSNFLIERGSPGVVIKKNELRAYFAHSAEDASVRKDVHRFLRAISGFYPGNGAPRLRWSIVRDRNWHSAWRRFFTAQKIGNAFWITPPWARPSGIRNRHVIIIQPGMAFGTGTHATTRGCLEFIERVARSFHDNEFTALDVGTGSGILAVALAKVGAKKVWALDNDAVALKVARKNLGANGVEKKIHLSGRELSRMRKSFPLVVANLTAETLLALRGALVKRVAPKGFLIVSGILKPKAMTVIRCFASDGLRFLSRKGEKEWVTLLLRRG